MMLIETISRRQNQWETPLTNLADRSPLEFLRLISWVPYERLLICSEFIPSSTKLVSGWAPDLSTGLWYRRLGLCWYTVEQPRYPCIGGEYSRTDASDSIHIGCLWARAVGSSCRQADSRIWIYTCWLDRYSWEGLTSVETVDHCWRLTLNLIAA